MKSPSHSKVKTEHQIPNDIDIEAELGMHPVRRPVDIEHDVTDLGQRKRVSSVLTSPVFKEELENVVTDLLRNEEYGFGLGGQAMAQDVATVLSPFNQRQFRFGGACVSPINDLTGSDTSLYTKGEKLNRCKLAAVYRLVDMFGWSQTIYNHITVRVSQEHEQFIINPFGLLYHEVSASKLLKVNMQGEVLDPGTTTLGFNKAGFILHSAIHASRPDIQCVIHVHTPDVVAVSMMECGLMPISQEALIIGEVSYHTYHGLVVDAKEKKALQKHLGPNNKVMFLRNHGLIACGETVEEAFHYLYHAMIACATQVKVMSCMKHEKIVHLDKAVLKTKTQDVVKSGEDNVPNAEVPIKWGVGVMMFEALMRMVDNMGYRSGYVYHNPITMQKKHRGKSDVELPATSFGHTAILPDDLDGELHHRLKSIPDAHEGAISGHASINGDVSPRNKTKWKKEGEQGSSHSTPARSDPNQFVPKNTDPREVIEKRKTIRGKGKWDENRPGPQSQLLHGMAPENKQLQDGQVVTGSKGIIQKDFHDSTVLAGPPNPFSNMTESELEDYQKQILKKDEPQEENNATEHQQTAAQIIAANTVVSVEKSAQDVESLEDLKCRKIEDATDAKQEEVKNVEKEVCEVKSAEKVFVESVTEVKKTEDVQDGENKEVVLQKTVSKKTVEVSKRKNDENNVPEAKKEETKVEVKHSTKEVAPKESKPNKDKKTTAKGDGESSTKKPKEEAPKKENDKGEKTKKRRSLSFLKKKKDKKGEN